MTAAPELPTGLLGSLTPLLLDHYGYLGGNHITAIYEQVHRYQLYALFVTGLAFAALIIRHPLWRQRTPKSARR